MTLGWRLLSYSTKMSAQSHELEPIMCAHLIRLLDRKLIDLLRSLAPDEWDLPTIVPSWSVRHVAAHLLDTALRKLSLARDNCFVEPAVIRSSRELAALVNRLNQDGVMTYGRLSPPVLIDLMQLACEQSAGFHESLDPFATACFAVSWAGEAASLNWFDTARELTERWHHQQQIRLTANRPGIMVRELYYPVLDCFARGLPHHYLHVDAPPGTSVQLDVSGPCGGSWLLDRQTDGWRLRNGEAESPDARVIIPEQHAWRIFTKGMSIGQALSHVEINGDRELGEKLLGLTAIVG